MGIRFIQTLPSRTLLDNTTFRRATYLCSGAPCVSPHFSHYGEAADCLRHHGLFCTISTGCISQHANINGIIRLALFTAEISASSSRTKPLGSHTIWYDSNGLVWDDGKWPDGILLLPCKMVRLLMYNATCVDTLAPIIFRVQLVVPVLSNKLTLIVTRKLAFF